MMKWSLPALTTKRRKDTGLDVVNSVTPRIITFWSPKATGKTILAAAAASALAGRGKRVACADFDLLTPDLPGGSYGFDRIAEEVLRGDFDPVETALNLPCLKPSGVHLLAGPTDTVRAEALGRSEILKLLYALAENYDSVVLDTNQTLAVEATLAALDVADLVIIPVNPRDSIVRHVGRYLGILEHDLRLDMKKIRLVVNRGAEKAALSIHDIERALGKKVVAEVPLCPEWENWNGVSLPPVEGGEEILLELVVAPAQTLPGKEAPSIGCSKFSG